MEPEEDATVMKHQQIKLENPYRLLTINLLPSLQEFHEVPYLKKFKFKRQDRVYPKEAPTQTFTAAKAEPLASASGARAEALPEAPPAGR